MKYRVLKFFIDRDSLQEYSAGDLFPCDSEERAKELIFKGYIERLQDAQEEKPVKEPAKPKTAKAKSTTVKKTATKKKA